MKKTIFALVVISAFLSSASARDNPNEPVLIRSQHNYAAGQEVSKSDSFIRLYLNRNCGDNQYLRIFYQHSAAVPSSAGGMNPASPENEQVGCWAEMAGIVYLFYANSSQLQAYTAEFSPGHITPDRRMICDEDCNSIERSGKWARDLRDQIQRAPEVNKAWADKLR